MSGDLGRLSTHLNSIFLNSFSRKNKEGGEELAGGSSDGDENGFGEFVSAKDDGNGGSVTDFGDWVATFPEGAGAVKSRAKNRLKKKKSGKKKKF